MGSARGAVIGRSSGLVEIAPPERAIMMATALAGFPTIGTQHNCTLSLALLKTISWLVDRPHTSTHLVYLSHLPNFLASGRAHQHHPFLKLVQFRDIAIRLEMVSRRECMRWKALGYGASSWGLGQMEHTWNKCDRCATLQINILIHPRICGRYQRVA